MNFEFSAGMPGLFPSIATVILVGIACITDIRSRRIPNILVLTGLIAGLANHLYISQLPGLWFWTLGLLAGMAFLIIPYLLGGMGAGDVKLLGMVGAIMGLEFVIATFLFMALWGGLGAMLVLFRSGRMRLFWLNILSLNFRAAVDVPDSAKEKDSLPYGVAIGLGVATTLLWRYLMSC